MAVFNLEDKDNGITELHQKLKMLPQTGEKIITDTLHNEGAEMIKKGIDALLPRSGRKRKSPRPASSNPRAIMMRKDQSKNLNVVVGTTYSYHYLYFPDDGSNTRKHHGNQHFMLKGAESQSEKVLETCINNLMKEIEK